MKKGIKNKDISDFEKCCSELKTILDRINIYAPEASIYIAEDQIHLMCDSSRDCGGSPSQDSIAASCCINRIDGGGW